MSSEDPDWADTAARQAFPHIMAGSDHSEDWHPDNCPCRLWPQVAAALRQAHQKGLDEGASCQAIFETQGRDRFLQRYRDELKQKVAEAEQRNLPPKLAGEDDVRYNGGEMVALFHELLGPVEYERFQKAVPWVRSEITQLVHRIYNLRRLNQKAEQRGREQERAELASWIEFYSDDSNGNDEQWRKLAAAIRARGKE